MDARPVRRIPAGAPTGESFAGGSGVVLMLREVIISAPLHKRYKRYKCYKRYK
jgi:hypothetical protein